MWIVRNKKDDEILLFHEKPVREEERRFLWWRWPSERWVCPYFERFRSRGEESKYGYLYYGLIPTPEIVYHFNKILSWNDDPIEIKFDI